MFDGLPKCSALIGQTGRQEAVFERLLHARRRSLNFYYAAHSHRTLKKVCDLLQRTLDLPPFKEDFHDTWRYAWSEGHGMRVNVTRASDSETIETWMTDCPAGVNYQIILTAGNEPNGFGELLAEALLTEAVRYAVLKPN